MKSQQSPMATWSGSGPLWSNRALLNPSHLSHARVLTSWVLTAALEIKESSPYDVTLDSFLFESSLKSSNSTTSESK